MIKTVLLLLAITTSALAETPIHPVRTEAELAAALAKIPKTGVMPPDLPEMLRAQSPVFLLEISIAPDCLPCGDAWDKLSGFGRRFGWRVRTINRQTALARMGLLGLPWIGDPVIFIRPVADERRALPVALGDDHLVNFERNITLGATMLDGLRPAIAVRMMSRFTGIVAPDMQP